MRARWKLLAVLCVGFLGSGCGSDTPPSGGGSDQVSSAAKKAPSPPQVACDNSTSKKNAGRYANCDESASNGCETNIDTSVSNCGACGNTCATPTNGTATCRSGTCGISCDSGYVSNGTSCDPVVVPPVCDPGYADCDSSTSNGCETNTETSATHCGACGSTCPAPANGTATCTAGSCGFTCESGYVVSDSTCVPDPASTTCATGYGNCDGDAATGTNGCETDVTSSTSHCSACGSACPAAPEHGTAACTNGSCGFVCDPGYVASGTTCVLVEPASCDEGYVDCDSDGTTGANGCEARVGSDCSNCGACGNVCAADQVCNAGVCGEPPPPPTFEPQECTTSADCVQNGYQGVCMPQTGRDGTTLMCVYVTASVFCPGP